MTTKWKPDLTREERILLENIPKATLFVIARQLGALCGESCDDLASGSLRILEEWVAQYKSGFVPQSPSRTVAAVDAAMRNTEANQVAEALQGGRR
jgi:hypothetical protein